MIAPRDPLDTAPRWTPWVLWVGFLALAGVTYASWAFQDIYTVVGDEPHYLVMADGILNDRTFEQTVTYEREFVERDIYWAGLAPAGAPATPETTHGVVGPNGLYNVHNIGLPLLLVVPFAIAGATATKLVLIAIVSLIVPLAWRITGRFAMSTRVRVMSIVATTYSLPFILGANQVFPDLPGGVLALVGIDRVLALAEQRRARTNTRTNTGGVVDTEVRVGDGTRSATAADGTVLYAPFDWSRRSTGRADAVAVAALLCLPWLQIKFAAAALLVAAALAVEWHRAGRRIPTIAVRLAPLLASLGLLAVYNQHAFGKASGPYTDGALVVSQHSMAVLAGLHLDRFQGILIQNPVYLVGLLFAVPFVRRDWLPAGLVILTYASFVVPNALHPVWYGGTAFAGRFAWSGAVVAIPAVLYGLARCAQLSRAAFYLVSSLAIGATTITWLAELGHGDLYNRDPNLEYPSLSPVAGQFLPAFRDPELAFRLGVNLTFLLLAVGLLVLGFAAPSEDAPEPDPGSHDEGTARPLSSSPSQLRSPAAAFGRVLGPFAAACLVLVVSMGVTRPYREDPVAWAAAQLPSNIGAIEGPFRTARSADGPGWVTYGPYIRLWRDAYSYRVELDAVHPNGLPVGHVEVFSPETATVFASHEVVPSSVGEPLVITGDFTVPDDLDEDFLEIRTYYNGEGEITVRSIELDVAT